jgi:hypothetical protein
LDFFKAFQFHLNILLYREMVHLSPIGHFISSPTTLGSIHSALERVVARETKKRHGSCIMLHCHSNWGLLDGTCIGNGENRPVRKRVENCGRRSSMSNGYKAHRKRYHWSKQQTSMHLLKLRIDPTWHVLCALASRAVKGLESPNSVGRCITMFTTLLSMRRITGDDDRH